MTDYYVSAAGNDSNDGTLASPWLTVTRANTALASMGLGNRVLFRRGDTFYGVLVPPTGLNPASPGWLQIGSYGDGALPVITGYKVLNTAAGWVAHDANTWKIDISAGQVGTTYTGYNSAQGTGDVGLLRVDGVAWGNRKPTLAELSSQWDFYTNETAPITLYVRSTAKPTTLAADVRATVLVNGVQPKHATIIRDLDLWGFGANGCSFQSGTQRARAIGCTVRDIGGSVLKAHPVPNTRYGNGIQVYTGTVGCSDIYCENNTVHDVYDVAWSPQGGTSTATSQALSDITWRRNLTYRCCQAEEYWYIGADPGFDNVVSEYNTNLFCGYGFGGDTRTDTNVRVAQLSYHWGDTPDPAPYTYSGDVTMRRNIYYDARGAFCYNAFLPLGQESDRNIIALRPNTKMRYQDTQTVEQAAAWSALRGREQNSAVHILPASADTDISDADVTAGVAALDGYAKTGQLFGGKAIPIHGRW